MDTSDWIGFGVRAALTLGVEVYRLVDAIKAGDIDVTKELAKRLDPPDQILAHGEAVRMAAHARALAGMQESER